MKTGHHKQTDVGGGSQGGSPVRRVCWCGNLHFQEFGGEYGLCPQCQTLVSLAGTAPETRITNEQDFYGEQYWYKHQVAELGFPNIQTRARMDMPERCLYWIRALLRYKLPPGKALEMGCAHGGFVSLLRWAGFDAAGLEISPSIADLARSIFDVPVLVGPVEDQSLGQNSLDVVVLMDVLEHLPEPLATIRQCVKLLRPDGVLLIQTPEYPAGKQYQQLVSEKSRFLEQLKPREHLFLFSQDSIKQFLMQAGLRNLSFEPAIFGHYDMFFVASRAPLPVRTPDDIAQQLCSQAPGRLVLALLDLDERFRNMTARYVESEADRGARLNSMHALEALLRESETDRAARLKVIEGQGGEIAVLNAELRSQQQARTEAVHRLGALESELSQAAARCAELNAELRSQQQARTEVLNRLGTLESELSQAMARCVALEGERAATARVIEGQRGEITGLNAELQRRQNRMDALEAELSQTHRTLGELQQRHDELDTSCQRLQNESRYRQGQWQTLLPALESFRNSEALHLLRWWRPLRELNQAAQAVVPEPARIEPRPRRPQTLSRVWVDLAPLQPGGENGGAKWLALELVRELARLTPDCQWILLASDKALPELAGYARENISCSRADARPRRRGRNGSPKQAWRMLGSNRSSLPRPDLVFCPFTTARLYTDDVPLVAVVHDLQYLVYPQFFSEHERSHRAREFSDVCRFASRIICVSDAVREAVVREGMIQPHRVKSVHTRLFHRLPSPAATAVARTLHRLHVEPGRYLLYPANFWAHKNHEMLLTAFGMYRARAPGSEVKLAFTGAPGDRSEELRKIARRMGLQSVVEFLGFLPGDDFAAVLSGCRAVIFPSLFEGFGLPVLEAMAFDKPVLCSNGTALSEVSGEAALFFDPRKPKTIVAALERLENDSSLAPKLVALGRRRLAELGGAEVMARDYLRIFQEALKEDDNWVPAARGIYGDGWTQDRITIVYDSSNVSRYLELELRAPPWLPSPAVSVTITGGKDRRDHQTRQIRRGHSVVLRRALPEAGGRVEIRIDPCFQPSAVNLGPDTRLLGCFCDQCRIVSVDGSSALYQKDR
ncbi:MAG TPA: glycosyltransferase [Verrucomicrobiae bacterium]|nr:glycosyltransferase [Verrucomicrobiae bacterium]